MTVETPKQSAPRGVNPPVGADDEHVLPVSIERSEAVSVDTPVRDRAA